MRDINVMSPWSPEYEDAKAFKKVLLLCDWIPTHPPNNLQRQPLLALTVLASRPGEVVTKAELADGMHKLGGLRKRPVAPEAKDLRYKILRPIEDLWYLALKLEHEVCRLPDGAQVRFVVED